MHVHENLSADGARPKCRGHKKDGSPCTNYPRKGGVVCNSHGGKAPQVQAKAQRRLQEGELRAELERLGALLPITDPFTALMEHAAKVRAWMLFLEERVSSLRHSSQWDTEQIRGEVELYTRAMKETRETLTDIARLKLDDRLIGVREATANMVLEAMKAGFASAGVTGVAQTNAIAVAGRHLRVIQGGMAPGDPGEDGPAREATGY